MVKRVISIIVAICLVCACVPCGASEDSGIPLEQQVSFTVAGSAGVITIPVFNALSCGQVADVLASLDEDISGIVIDLRGNAGGLLEAAARTADLFIDDGVIFTVIENGEACDYPAGNSEPEVLNGRGLYILVNALTASAAEAFASAVRESGAGIIVGTRTFGKSAVSRVTINESGAVCEVVGKFLTRGGSDIAGTGIEPDIRAKSARQMDVVLALLNE